MLQDAPWSSLYAFQRTHQTFWNQEGLLLKTKQYKNVSLSFSFSTLQKAVTCKLWRIRSQIATTSLILWFSILSFYCLNNLFLEKNYALASLWNDMNMFFSNTPYYLQYNRLIVRNTLLACSKLMKSELY